MLAIKVLQPVHKAAASVSFEIHPYSGEMFQNYLVFQPLWHPSWLSFLISWTMEFFSPAQVLSLDGNLCAALLVSPNLKMLWDTSE